MSQLSLSLYILLTSFNQSWPTILWKRKWYNRKNFIIKFSVFFKSCWQLIISCEETRNTENMYLVLSIFKKQTFFFKLMLCNIWANIPPRNKNEDISLIYVDKFIGKHVYPKCQGSQLTNKNKVGSVFWDTLFLNVEI